MPELNPCAFCVPPSELRRWLVCNACGQPAQPTRQLAENTIRAQGLDPTDVAGLQTMDPLIAEALHQLGVEDPTGGVRLSPLPPWPEAWERMLVEDPIIEDSIGCDPTLMRLSEPNLRPEPPRKLHVVLTWPYSPTPRAPAVIHVVGDDDWQLHALELAANLCRAGVIAPGYEFDDFTERCPSGCELRDGAEFRGRSDDGQA